VVNWLAPLVAEYDENGNLVAKYHHDGGGLMAMTRNNSSYWYSFEAIGMTRQLIDGQGQVSDAYAFDAWGNELTHPQSQVPNPFKYVGKHGYYLDTESALMLLGVRYYGANVGRFMSLDPLRDGMNWYAYGSLNPSNHFDPTGLEVRIGPVPPEKSCANYPPTTLRVTDCNLQKGKPWMLICNRDCDVPCTDTHEGQHCYDLAKCCELAAKCIERTDISDRACELAFRQWQDRNRQWAECRGYRSGLYCRQKMAKKRNCWCKPWGQDRCCDILRDSISRDQDRIQRLCAWGPPPVRCPFNSDGTIRRQVF